MSRVQCPRSALADPIKQFGDIDRVRRADFVSLRLALTTPLIALAPIFLIARGAPSDWEVLTFALLLTPLLGVYALHRFGRLDVAQVICVGGLVLLGAVLACASGGLTIGAVACFLLAPVEAATGGMSRLAIGGAALAVTAIAVLMAAAHFGYLHPIESRPAAIDLSVVVAAVLYGALLAIWGARLSELRDSRASQSMETYRELTATLGDMLMRLDLTGAVVDAATDPCNGFRFCPADLREHGLFERILVSDRPRFLKSVADAARSDQTVSVEFRLRAPSPVETKHEYDRPQYRWVEMRAHRSIAMGGAIIAILRDVTPTREAREVLEAARKASEQANKWKSRLLANVSHELRTPLNAIIGFSEMLASEELAPKEPARQREYADIIHVSGEHLLSLVNSILDMSKIEAGSFEIEPEHFNLPGLIDFCCEVMKLKAEEKHISLTRSCPEQIDEIVADKRACKQILLNLLSNAVKFTPERGSVSVAARLDGAFVEIAVADTGIGVMQTDLSRLGDPFFQAKATYDRPYEGAGLGLSIVRGLVGLHGGAISFESEPNEGACVTVRLPLDCRRTQKNAEKSARIETLARRGRPPAASLPRSKDQVKKIA